MPRPKLPLPLLIASLILLGGGDARAQGRVPFVFTVDSTGKNPFEREISAEVSTPAGVVLLPAFYLGGNRYSVRAAASRPGVYRLGAVAEIVDGRPVPLRARPAASADTVRVAARLPFVRVDPQRARRFMTDRGTPYLPVGTNLGWGPPGQEPRPFYRRELADLAQLGVNWVRIWMCHWGGLNLDWRPRGPSPTPGTLDSVVARRIDDIVDAAADRGIYIQLVLQHHGQFSTQVNPNWGDNPWNAARPHGFLARPADFFTSPQARQLTRAKYRYIVARWGYSPAILAWELFNEVQWVDALRIEHDEAAVAAWHAEMADYIRSIDEYHHPVTTSYDDLSSPIFAHVDYLQPHLYAGSGIAPLRQFYTMPPEDGRPLFYGETGFDNFRLTPAERSTGLALVHPLWAGLMGEAEYPAQMWYWDRLPDPGRHAEFAQFVGFVRAADLGQRFGLMAFSPAVESDTRVPLVVERARNQGSRPVPEIVVPSDGSEPVSYADVPQFLAGTSARTRPGEPPLPDRVAFRVRYPAAARAVVHFENVSGHGSAARVTVDGSPVAEQTWPVSAGSGTDRVKQPGHLSFTVPAGEHVVALESTGQSGLEIGSIDLGLPMPALAAIGKRNADFVMLWVWHRTGFMTGAPPARATVLLADLPAGSWQITWWGPTAAAQMPAPATVVHPGGTLRLETPRIGRFAAVTLRALKK